MRALVRLLLLAAIATMVPAAPLQAQAEERTVFVSVVDKSDTPVPGLAAGEFTVREDEVTREVLRASAATEPLNIALLVDTSQAIDSSLAELRLALRAFFKQMGGKHEIALIGFGERPTVLVDYTRDAARLENGIGTVYARTGSGTYALEAIMEASEGLRRRKAARPHIVVIAAQGPEFSEHHHDAVLQRLRESGATLHTLVVTKPGLIRTERPDQELDMSIADGTRMTGGRRDDLLASMMLMGRLQALGAELQAQYQVTYARPRALLPPKEMEVGTKRPGVTVRARRWP